MRTGDGVRCWLGSDPRSSWFPGDSYLENAQVCPQASEPPSTTLLPPAPHQLHPSSSSLSRLNYHVATLAAVAEGAIILDSTRKGKAFPDSLSRTVPIWASVMNRAVGLAPIDPGSAGADLQLPEWVPASEAAQIASRLDAWAAALLGSGVDLSELRAALRRPFRCLWISQRNAECVTPETLSRVRAHSTPLVLVSASCHDAAELRTNRHSWTYVQGAGDDHQVCAEGGAGGPGDLRTAT